MQKWLLPTLSEILARSEQAEAEEVWLPPQTRQGSDRRSTRRQLKAQREWQGAIAALEKLLLQLPGGQKAGVKGLVLAAPVPVLSCPELAASLQTGIFSANQFQGLGLMPFLLPPGDKEQAETAAQPPFSLPLLPADPLAEEQFCLVLTEKFSLVMVLGENISGTPAFLFSFAPEVVEAAWETLRHRLVITNCQAALKQLDALAVKFAPVAPDYRTATQFARWLLQNLPEEGKVEAEPKAKRIDRYSYRTAQVKKVAARVLPAMALDLHEDEAIAVESAADAIAGFPSATFAEPKANDVEFLQAFAHEVRTPLTTIRTLIRLLLRRKDLAADAIERLEAIERECTEQIDRMELIFKAVELETANSAFPVSLTPTPLDELLQNRIPRWQKQASRRCIDLEVVLPQKLPHVASNPAMLDQVLSGLIENFTRSLPGGSHVQVEFALAGDRLKLEVRSQLQNHLSNPFPAPKKDFKSLGQLLSFEPETGSISLNLNATKNLFHALGGKLIVRQKPQAGEVLTIFLPLH